MVSNAIIYINNESRLIDIIKLDMNNIFTICYSEEEANEIGHFIMRKGYEWCSK